MKQAPRPSWSKGRRWLGEERGFAGAEKALLICAALAVVLGVGALIQGGSQQAASDAKRTLSDQSGGGKLGAVVRPIQAAGDVRGGQGAPVPAEAGKAPAGTTPTAVVVAGIKVPAPIAVQSGLGAAVDAIAANSPTLAGNINTLESNGWTIRYGAAGSGSFTDRNARTITIDASESSNPMAVAQTLAHESGHAMYTPDAYTPPNGLTRDQYVNASVWHNLRDEGEATITNLQVRKELLAAGAGDIGVAGAQSDQYQALFNQWNGQNRDQLRTDMGRIYATGEHPSTDPGSTYWQYYARTFENFYDREAPKVPRFNDQNVGRQQ